MESKLCGLVGGIVGIVRYQRLSCETSRSITAQKRRQDCAHGLQVRFNDLLLCRLTLDHLAILINTYWTFLHASVDLFKTLERFLCALYVLSYALCFILSVDVYFAL